MGVAGSAHVSEIAVVKTVTELVTSTAGSKQVLPVPVMSKGLVGASISVPTDDLFVNRSAYAVPGDIQILKLGKPV